MTVDKIYQPRRILVLGATGTIGRAAVQALVERGHIVVALVRRGSPNVAALTGAEIREADITDARSIAEHGFRGEAFDVMLSCLASRSGGADDARKIDFQAHLDALHAAKNARVGHMILLSAICVHKPLLAFQHAKLAFEKELIESGLTYSIVRPTAFFKSLSGQIDRVKKGKSFLVFGDGTLTACKPISDRDLADYLADCVDEPSMQNRVLPIGGPGDAITPLQQGNMLFGLLGKEPHFRHVPVRLLDFIIAALGFIGKISPAAAKKADLARIGRYYATESMLVWNSETACYDAAATPSTGSDTLAEHYLQIINGQTTQQRGEHSVF